MDGRRQRARATLLLACVILIGAGGCQAAQVPSAPAPSRRPTTVPGAATPQPAPRVTAHIPTPVPAAATAPAAYGSPAPTATQAPACAAAGDFARSGDYLGSFRFEPIATSGRTGIISDTRIVIRSAAVPGSNTVQFAFWFQGRGGQAAPYANQLRFIANASCLDPVTGAGTATIVPALRPGDFLIPPLPFGESARAGLDGSDPYGFRLYIRAPDGSLSAETLPAEYGFITGGTVKLAQYGPGLEAWHASGTVSLTMTVRSGQPVPVIDGRFDVLSP